MIKICICDDEKSQLLKHKMDILRILGERKQNIEIKAFISGNDLLKENEQFHVAFLDIDMPGISGIELSKVLRARNNGIYIVFLTGYDTYALQAYEVEAIGYLVKPIKYDKLAKLLEKILSYIYLDEKARTEAYLVITDGGIKKKIIQREILYIEKIRNVSKIYTLSGIYSIYESFINLKDHLENYLVQVNQGIIVNLNFILRIEKNEIYLKNNLIYSIGRKYMKDVKKYYFNT